MSVEHLGKEGRALHAQMMKELEGSGLVYDAKEAALLMRACQVADTIAALDEAVARDGVTVAGSRGQITTHPAVAERRLQELNLLRLLKAIGLPEEAPSETPRQKAARKAARARWGARENVARRRG